MPIFIYNSLTRKKEEFVPINCSQVKMYTCGVTVYDACHIGHARSLYIFDVIRRYLKYRGFEVKFVRNITDVDDKIINRSNELKVQWQELVEKYIGKYCEDLKALGIEKGDFEPRATENIADMIKYIQTLIDKDYAYEAGGDVYFNVRKFPGYGKLSGQSIDQMETGVRIGPSEIKHDPLDFALWKKSKENEPFWDSPWSKGRPGWHIECSVMSQKFLKTQTLDIHAGGRDLIFPHHENEIAQAEALTGKQFAKYWIHHGLLTINAQKMSKSLGNFITIKDFLEQHSDIKLKIFFLSAHYHSPMDYNEVALHAAAENAETFDIFFHEMNDYKNKANDCKEAAEFKERFIKAMDDDFNTPIALSILLEMVSAGHRNIRQNKLDVAMSISKLLEELLAIFNLDNIKIKAQGLVNLEEIVNKLSALQDEYKELFSEHGISLVSLGSRFDELGPQKRLVESFIQLRNYARLKKDFLLADKIRTDLSNKSRIILEDTKDGRTSWRVKL